MTANQFTNNTKNFFDQRADLYQKVNLLVFSKSGKMEVEKFYQFFNPCPKANLIELGAGYGRFVIPLLELGHKVTAVDISQKSIKVINREAKKHQLEKRLKLIKSDFTQPVFENVYDGAYCIGTFHLLAETEKQRIKILSNLVKSVKPGGIVLLIEPNPFNPFFYPFYLFSPQVSWEVEKHFRKSNEKNLMKIFKQLGLKDITVSYFGFFPLRFVNYFPAVAWLNQMVNYLPLVNKVSSFIYIRGVRASSFQKSNIKK